MQIKGTAKKARDKTAGNVSNTVCGHCIKMNAPVWATRHPESRCFKLHPELEKEVRQKSRDRQKARLAEKQKKLEEEDQQHPLQQPLPSTPAQQQHLNLIDLSMPNAKFPDEDTIKQYTSVLEQQLASTQAQSPIRKALLESFIVDSAAQAHSTVKPDLFVGPKRPFQGAGISGVGPNSTMPLWTGTVKVPTSNEYFLLDNCHYNPAGGVNIISSTQLQEKGVKFVSEGPTCTATIGNRQLFTAHLSQRLLWL